MEETVVANPPVTATKRVSFPDEQVVYTIDLDNMPLASLTETSANNNEEVTWESRLLLALL